MTNTRSSRGLDSFQPVREGPIADLNTHGWKRLESSSIAVEWQTRTSAKIEIKNNKIFGWFLKRKPLFEDTTTIIKFEDQIRREDEEERRKRMTDRINLSRKELRLVSDPAIRRPETENILLAVVNSASTRQNDELVLPDANNALEFYPIQPEMWALLGAPGNRWFFELLYHWRPMLGHKIPDNARLYKTSNNQVGISWVLLDYDEGKAQEIRLKIKQTKPDGFGPDAPAGPPAPKRPASDGDAGPAPKKPSRNVQGSSRGTVDLNQGYYGH